MNQHRPLLVRIDPDLREPLDRACTMHSRSRPKQVRHYLVRCLRDEGILSGETDGIPVHGNSGGNERGERDARTPGRPSTGNDL